MFSSYDFLGFLFSNVHKLSFPIPLMLNMLAELSSKNIFFKQSTWDKFFFFFFCKNLQHLNKRPLGLAVFVLWFIFFLLKEKKRLHCIAGLLFSLMYWYICYYLATYEEILTQITKSRILTIFPSMYWDTCANCIFLPIATSYQDGSSWDNS